MPSNFKTEIPKEGLWEEVDSASPPSTPSPAPKTGWEEIHPSVSSSGSEPVRIGIDPESPRRALNLAKEAWRNTVPEVIGENWGIDVSNQPAFKKYTGLLYPIVNSAGALNELLGVGLLGGGSALISGGTGVLGDMLGIAPSTSKEMARAFSDLYRFGLQTTGVEGGIRAPRLSPADETTYVNLLKSGTEKEITDFFSNKPGFSVKPQEVADWVKTRDLGGKAEAVYKDSVPPPPSPIPTKVEPVLEQQGALVEAPSPVFPQESVLDVIKPAPDLEGPKYAQNINLHRLMTNEDQNQILQATVGELRLPTQTHEEVVRGAQEFLLKKTPSDLLLHDPPLGKSAEYAAAVRTTLVGALRKSDEIEKAILQAEKITPELQEQFTQLRLLTAAASERVSNVAGQFGRNLNSLKIVAGKDGKALTEALSKIEAGNVDTRKLAEQFQLARLMSDDASAVEKLAKDSLKPFWEDKITSFRYSMMLSSPVTQMKNLLGNTLTFATDLADHGVASVLGQVKRFNKDADRIYMRENVARIVGAVKALADSSTYLDAVKSWKEGVPAHSISKVETKHTILPGVLGYPVRGLSSVDSLTRSIIQNSSLYGEAVHQAIREGNRGPKLLERAQELIENPSDEMWSKTDDYAATLQLISDPSILARKLEGVKAKVAGMSKTQRVVRFAAMNVFPFSRVADNLLWFNIRHSPLGIFDKRNLADLKAGGSRKDLALGRLLMGSAVVGYFAMRAMNGEQTGDGPRDYRKRAELQAGGWQPNSFKVGDRYYSLNGLDAISVSANAVTSLVEQYKSGELSEEEYVDNALNIAGNIAGNLSDATFTKNIGDFLAMFGTDSRAELARQNYLSNFASSFEPAIGRQVARLQDPYMRDTTGTGSSGSRILNKLKEGVPGLSEELPQKMDVYGRPLLRSGGPISKLTGILSSSEVESDPAAQELQRLAAGEKGPLVGPISKTLNLGDGVSRRLTAEEAQEYQRQAGQYVLEHVRQRMQDQDWDIMTDEEKNKEIKDAEKEFRKQAREDLFSPKDTTGSEEGSWEELQGDNPSSKLGDAIAKEFDVSVTDSGVRSEEEQRRLFENYKGVARPGTSPHEFGRAIDVRPKKGVNPSKIKAFLLEQGLKNVKIITKLHGTAPHWHFQWDYPQ